MPLHEIAEYVEIIDNFEAELGQPNALHYRVCRQGQTVATGIIRGVGDLIAALDQAPLLDDPVRSYQIDELPGFVLDNPQDKKRLKKWQCGDLRVQMTEDMAWVVRC